MALHIPDQSQGPKNSGSAQKESDPTKVHMACNTERMEDGQGSNVRGVHSKQQLVSPLGTHAFYLALACALPSIAKTHIYALSRFQSAAFLHSCRHACLVAGLAVYTAMA